MTMQMPQSDRSSQTQLANDMNRFAFRLCAQLCQANAGNLFLSPSSISTALSMTLAGAAGDTRKELQSALGHSLPEETVHQTLKEMAEKTRTGGVEFHLANRLWGHVGYSFLDDYLDITRHYYKSELARVDFVSRPDAARTQINEWVEEQTSGCIKDMIPEGMINPLTRLMLTNAVYFLGTWESPFKSESTRAAEFKNADGSRSSIPMMEQVVEFGYAESAALQVLDLPYRSYGLQDMSAEGEGAMFEARRVVSEGNDFTMTILLPREGNGASDLISWLAENGLSRLPRTENTYTRVRIPRFKLSSEFSLVEPLQSLGAQLAFSPDHADFRRMSDEPGGLYVHEALHRACVDVDEKGTEAVAATGVMMCMRSATPEPKDFVADRPFVFVIQDRATGVVHFIGKLETAPSD